MDGKEFAPVSDPLTVNSLKLRRVGETGALAARQGSDGQFLPAAAPPSIEHPSSSDRAHALAETVGFGALPSVRLISTLHNSPLVRFSDSLISNALLYPRDTVPSNILIQQPQGHSA